MPFFFRKVLNSSLVKFVALYTITTGNPNVANDFLKEMVVADVEELVICTSNHLE